MQTRELSDVIVPGGETFGASRTLKLAATAREVIQRIALRPRFAGSPAETEARAMCTAELEKKGFAVTEEPFEFSEFPAKWGPPLIAAGCVSVAYITGSLTWNVSASAGLAGLAVAGALLAFAARRLQKTGTRTVQLMRSRAVNLVGVRGTRGAQRPHVWLVAHLDSKSQTIPMLVRIASASVVALALSLMSAAAIAGAAMELLHLTAQFSSAEWLVRRAVLIGFWTTSIGSLPLLFCLIGSRSDGAVDNASGVAAVLMALDEIDARRSIGVLFTSAEELGLAGARAFVADNPQTAIAINCDTVDDAGQFIAMRSGKISPALENGLLKAAARHRISIRIRSMLPGVLADNIAFTDAGWDSVTISRGNLDTLARVHTGRDGADRITGTGIAQAAGLIAATVEELA